MHLQSITINRDAFPVTDAYPFCLPVLNNTGTVAFTTPVTFFTGENGTGKSTLLEGMAKRCRIHIWRGWERTRYGYNPYERSLYKCLDMAWEAGPVPGSFFASQIFRNFSQLLDEWAASDPGILKYFGGESLMTKSHGQSLMAFFNSRFARRGLYLVDEPETALSPLRQVELLRMLQTFAATGEAQFIIATHSPILMGCPGARLLGFDGDRIEPVRYRDTEHYRVYKRFLNDPEAFIKDTE